MPLFSHWPCPIYFQLIAGLQLCSIYAHGLRGVKPDLLRQTPPSPFKDSHGPLLTEHHSLPLTFKKEKLWKRCLCVWSVSGILEWKIKCVCGGACVCVCVCGGEWAVHCSLHLCGSPLLFQVATCSFLVQKEHRGPKQKGGTQTLGEANEALGLPNTEDDKWGPSLSGFIIESPWVCPNHGNQFKQ